MTACAIWLPGALKGEITIWKPRLVGIAVCTVYTKVQHLPGLGQ